MTHNSLVCRLICSYSTNYAKRDDLPMFSDLIRKLYLKVHPDLLPNHPIERDINNTSLALLNSFLNDIRTGQHFQQNNISFQFYVLPLQENEDQEHRNEDEHKELKLVQVKATFSNSNPMSSRSQVLNVLRDLFEKCGLESDFNWGDYANFQSPSLSGNDFSVNKVWRTATESRQTSSAFLLRKESKGNPNDNDLTWFFSFMRNSHAKAIDLRTNNAELNIRSRAMIAELRLSGFRVIIEDEHDMPISEQYELVSRFYQAFKTHTLNDIFKNSSVFVIAKKEETGVDQLGRICLNAEDVPSEWLDLVQKLAIDARYAEKIANRNPDGVLHRQEFSSLKKIESDVASKLGIYDIFAEYAILGKRGEDYFEFLSKLASASHSFKTLSESFTHLNDVTLVASTSAEIRNEPDLGVVLIPVDANVDDIICYLDENGSTLTEEQGSYERKNIRYESMILDVKRKLRISSLSKDPIVSQQEFEHCILGLKALPDNLRRLFHGIGLVVSDRFEFQDRGLNGTLKVHWDCLKLW